MSKLTLEQALDMIGRKSDIREVLLALLERDELSQKERNDIVKKAISEILDNHIPEMKESLLKEIISQIPSFIPDPLKGDKGDGPSKTELLKIIKPLIPTPIPGDKGEPGISVKGEQEKTLHKLTRLFPKSRSCFRIL